MSIRWTIGALIAALACILALPGIASADHHAHVNANTVCDGTFVIDADYHPSSGTDRRVYISVNGDNWDDDFDDSAGTGLSDDIPGPYGTIVDQDGAAYVATGGDDYFLYTTSAQSNDFFVMNGNYDNVVAAPGSAITVNADLRNTDNSQASGDDSATVTAGPDLDDDANNDWEKCVIDYCEAGDSDGGSDYSFKATPDNNCDPVRLCVDGESMTVTEFAAESLDGEKGSCTPSEDPPAITTSTVTETEPAVETVEPTEEAVAEVSPAVDVAALPSAGYGDDGGISYGWLALFALAVVGLGGATALMARPRK